MRCADIGALEGRHALKTLHMARRRSKLKDATWYTKLHINPETSAKLAIPQSCMITYKNITLIKLLHVSFRSILTSLNM